MSKENLEGLIFERLTVLREDITRQRSYWICLCECGNEKSVAASHLKSGKIRSCGCLVVEGTYRYKHGMAYSRQYNIWCGILKRCNNPNNPAYKFYGACGITVCDRWDSLKGGSFINFWEDMEEGYADNLTLDRIDPKGDYCKENCRWVDRKIQAFNQKLRVTNSSGKTGVSWIDSKKLWQVSIEGNFVGYYATFEEAVEVRVEKEIEVYGFSKQ